MSDLESTNRGPTGRAKYFTPTEAADILRLPEHWDRERWVRTRCKDGRIRAKQISRGVWRISDAALAEFLAPAELAPADTADAPPVESIVEGLSRRSRRRLAS